MNDLKIEVIGMMCEGCEKRIVNSLSTIEGVNEVIANHKEGTVVIKSNEIIDKETVKEMIIDLGFEVKED